MDEQAFLQFIAERPALNLSTLAIDLKVDSVNLHKIFSGLRKIPKTKLGLVYTIAQKYEYPL